jgi:hypothetical protein
MLLNTFLNPRRFLASTECHTHIKQRVKFWSMFLNFRLLDITNVPAADTGVTEMHLLAQILLLT